METDSGEKMQLKIYTVVTFLPLPTLKGGTVNTVVKPIFMFTRLNTLHSKSSNVLRLSNL